MNKIKSVEEAVALIKDGDSVLVGGFYGIGTPHQIVDEIVRQKKKNLTIITIEAGSPDYGIGKLIENGCVSKIITSWIGNLKSTIQNLLEQGKLEMEINPQGTLVERIRAGGYGLGGVLTQAGLGTYVEEKKIGQRVTFNQKDWLYHMPIKANVCIVEAYQGDEIGNLVFKGTQTNFNNIMCTAADLVIASIMAPISQKGSINPAYVQVPGVFVDILVQTDVKQVERTR
jgi:acetate CoA/acetoacetate CoA-transferase alpha subunit